jgi:hypothetical protein
MAEERYLDDIGEAPEGAAPSPAPEQSEPPAAETHDEGQEPPADGQERPKKPDTRPEGYVTKGERDRIASELQQERQQRAAAEDRFAKMVERFYKDNAPDPATDDPKPDYNQDPLGYIAWKDRQETREAEARATQQKEWEQQQEEQRQFQDTLNRATARFQKVVASRPEVGKLYQDVQNHVAGLYAAQGTPMHEIPALVQRYEAEVIKWARQEYIPIEDALEQAAAAFGIKAQAAAPTEQRPTPERDPATGQFLPSEAEKAAKVRESQERNASLSAAPGAPVKKMTPAELAKMPEEEMWRHFESLKGQKGAKNFDRDMGFRS